MIPFYRTLTLSEISRASPETKVSWKNFQANELIFEPSSTHLSFATRSHANIERCLTIGRCQAVTGEFRNALALYARSLDLSSSALSIKSTATPKANDGPPKLDIASEDLQGFHHHIDGMVSQYRAVVELKNLMSQQKASTTDIYRPPIVERLREYPIEDVDLMKLVNFPPKLQPIPVKPLFLDVAWNYIDYPGRATSKVNGTPEVPKTAPQEEKEPAKKGWFGFGR